MYKIKEIIDFPGYKIDTSGDVWSCWKPKGIRSFSNSRFYGSKYFASKFFKKLKPGKIYGYCFVGLRKNKKTFWKRIHRLVLEAFIGKCPKNMEACHNNGNRSDNRLENLRWDTYKKNNADKKIHGTEIFGERNGNKKFNLQQIKLYRLLHDFFGWQRPKLSKIFNLPESTIRQIIKRERWSHI